MSYDKPSWTKEEPNPSGVSKEMVEYLQESGQYDFLIAHKLTGDLGDETSNGSKPGASEASSGKLKPFESASFGKLGPYEAISPGKPGGAYEPVSPVPLGGKAEANAVGEHTAMYTKVVTKAGKSQRIPHPEDTVSILYTTRVEETGIEFDTNVRNASNRKASPPLGFQVGTGRVIRGLDQALMTMMVRGERATLTIQPEWAYGHQGIEAAGIPPNAVLIFDVELIALERAF
ncbi:FK506-binding protein 2B [Coemansia sp. RSA 1200]|nr:FK506-binding protein 2B [Coemansia sp. RSA 1200]